MPPKFLIDPNTIDLQKVAYDKAAIRELNPQRGDMEMLDGVNLVDPVDRWLVGFKDVRSDEFWVPYHIPGRPLFPGVLMIESAAQLSAFYTRKVLGWDGFIGFGGVEECRFRKAVEPPSRLYVVGKHLWERHSRICCQIQGIVDMDIVFEATIIGVRM